MLRYRMNKIINLLENNSFPNVRDIVLAPENEKVLKVLIDLKCVQPLYAWGGEIVNLKLLNHSATYTLERRDIWLNRFYGFMAGVLTTVAGTLLIHAVQILL